MPDSAELPRELLVLRHAKSSWDTPAPSDFERPLAKRGRKDAPRIGAYLRERDLIPDHVLCSTAVRAKETVVAVLEGAGEDAGAVRFVTEIYHGGLGTLLELLGGSPQEFRRVMLVGHNPDLESLVGLLSGEKVSPTTSGKAFPTGALAHFRMPEDWTTLARGSGELVTLVRPRELRDD